MKKLSCCGSMLLVLIVGGCSSQQVEIDPLLLPVDAEFSQQSMMTADQRPWWLNHGDPVLTSYIEEALENNQDLLVVYERLQQAAAFRDSRASARWFAVDAGVTQQRDTDSGEDSYRGSVDASYELDLWGRVAASVEDASLQYRAQRFDYQTAAVTLSAEVADSWYQWQESLQRQRLLEKQLEANIKRLEVIDLRFKSGSVVITDVSQQRQQVESNRAKLTQVKAEEANARYRFNVLLGRSPNHAINESLATLPAIADRPETGLPLELLERRADVKSAWTSINASQSALAAAIKDRYPRISLGYHGESASANSSDLFDSWLNQLTASIIGPVIDGGQRRAEVRRQQAVVRESVHHYNSVMLNAIEEVEKALVNEQQQQLYLASISKQKALAYFTLQRKQVYYHNGATNYLDVLTAQNSAQELELQELTAQRQLLSDRIELYRVLSGGWPLADE
ncbi:efflux transporter outer membrane subunit [Sinobacterium caligoides]|uniref:efflux transporter outer membrane subunit n=1 Tax=Sinobacterium caligoides TaxID=933926 RepID=UPI0013C2CE2A|nr:TolC family protein [Sinobacterium caligoides]